MISQWVRITDRGRLRVAVLNPTNNNLYLATDADPGSILRVIPPRPGQNSDVWARSMPRRLS